MTKRRHNEQLYTGLALYWIIWLGAAAVYYLGLLPRAMVERAEDAVRAIPYVHEVDGE